MDAHELCEKADTAFTNKQFIEGAKLYIEAGKAGHSDCIDTLYKIDPQYTTLDPELLVSKVAEYFKQEYQKLEQAKDKPFQLYFDDLGPNDICDSEYDVGPIGACYSDYEDGPIGAYIGDDDF